MAQPRGGLGFAGVARLEDRAELGGRDSAFASVPALGSLENHRRARRGRAHGAGQGAGVAEPGGRAGVRDCRDAGRRAVAGAAVPALGLDSHRVPAARIPGVFRGELQPAAGRGLQLLPLGEAGGGPGLLYRRRPHAAAGGVGGNLVAAAGRPPDAPFWCWARWWYSRWFPTERPPSGKPA